MASVLFWYVPRVTSSIASITRLALSLCSAIAAAPIENAWVCSYGTTRCSNCISSRCASLRFRSSANRDGAGGTSGLLP
eukprot:6353392-Prymnesium_polylepis.2